MKTFNFYTYDESGKDIILGVYAPDEDTAWDEFERIYGDEYYIDQVLVAK